MLGALRRPPCPLRYKPWPAAGDRKPPAAPRAAGSQSVLLGGPTPPLCRVLLYATPRCVSSLQQDEDERCAPKRWRSFGPSRPADDLNHVAMVHLV